MLHAFRSIPVVREVTRGGIPDAAAAFARDTTTLGWEDRLKARGRRRSDGGVEFGIALERGIVLREGDCFVLEHERLVVTVIEAAEAVFVIGPRTGQEWARFAYQIGNSHQPLMLTTTAIVCPDVPGMEQVLGYHGIPFVRAELPFTPLTSAGDLGAHRHQP